MNVADIITIGPLALALDRLVAASLMLAFLVGMDWIVARDRTYPRRPALLALLTGLVAARIAYVWIHRESFGVDPQAALQVWLGGWEWRAGVATAALFLIAVLRKPRTIVASLALLVTLAAIWWTFATAQSSRPATSLPADFRMETVDRHATTLADNRDRPRVLNLWASWCAPCRREMPMLVDAASRETRAVILLVNQGETLPRVQSFLKSQNLSMRHVVLDPGGRLGATTGSSALPTTIFVGVDGRIQGIHVGEISRVQLDIAIRALTEAGNSAR